MRLAEKILDTLDKQSHYDLVSGQISDSSGQIYSLIRHTVLHHVTHGPTC